MTKLIRDGKVAVLISPGFGAGWSTWNSNDEHTETLLFDSEIVQAVLDGDLSKAAELASAKTNDEVYTGGAEDLMVTWLPLGTQFIVTEYDGSESIRTNDGTHWHVA